MTPQIKALRQTFALVLACMAVGATTTARAADAPAFPPYTLANTQLRTLPRSSNGRDYILYVALPGSYAKERDRKYPVFYVCDAYWCFPRMHGIRDLLVYDKVVPEYIIVGLGYAGENLNYNLMRLHELLPVKLPKAEDSGHAEEFLGVIEREIIPFVEREYRTDPSHRVLSGSSFGGVFVLYAMFTRPELFWGYIANSPVVHVGDDWMFAYEEAFAKSGRPLNTRLFMSMGSLEWPSQVESIRRFDTRLAGRKYSGLAYEFRVVEGERHGGANPEADTHALQFMFRPLAPDLAVRQAARDSTVPMPNSP